MEELSNEAKMLKGSVCVSVVLEEVAKRLKT